MFLYEQKFGHNTAKVARNINGAFGDGTASECTIRFWFSKRRAENESLEKDDRGRLLRVQLTLRYAIGLRKQQENCARTCYES